MEAYGVAGNTESLTVAKKAKVEIRNVRKVFINLKGEELVAIEDMSLEIGENEFVCIVGPSGCGKSTILNIMAGLETETSGSVYVDGKLVEGTSADRGVVFQQYALFPWLTVKKNVEFGLRLKRDLTRKEVSDIADHYIKTVGLSDFATAYPKELSGGMKQRVAIARAYAVRPELLLLDEPFGAVDAQTRAQLQTELLHTWQEEKRTCFFITHDVEEAVILAQRVVVMTARPGRIKSIVNIDINYPRTQETKLEPRFNELKNMIWAQVYNEYLEHIK